ncbi:hypothetical protein BPSOL_1677 [Bifidobacterium pseudolongum]|nr:hypothetical protein BPSOL_1677 [Bifidobacterium pseudolongum]
MHLPHAQCIRPVSHARIVQTNVHVRAEYMRNRNLFLLRIVRCRYG